MKIIFSQKPSPSALVIYPVFKGERVKDTGFSELISNLAASKEFNGSEGQIFFACKSPKIQNEKIILVGMGDKSKLKVESVMRNLGSATKAAMAHKSHTIAITVHSALRNFMESAVTAGILSSYIPSAPFKTGAALKRIQKQEIKTLEFCGQLFTQEEKNAAKNGEIAAEVQNEVKAWVNAPPNFSNIAFFESTAKKIASETGATLTILKKKELEKLGMGALLGVNRGGRENASLVILDYNPNKKFPSHLFKKAEAPIALVGKGIIFDSGGYNLKPRGHIEDMQLDKAGAAAVLAMIKVLKRLGIKRRVIAAAPFTENLIGENALKPSEIVKTYSGKTVEVTNTDAEGRLVLADAISYVIDKYKPKFLIDVATLTGACMVALGDRYAGIMGTDEGLMKKLQKAGDEVDELLWPLPMHRDYNEKMKGVYADLCNSDNAHAMYAGASKGAAFIKEFVGKTPWVHMDIASPAFTSDPKKYEQKGATGFGVRVLKRFFENLDAKE